VNLSAFFKSNSISLGNLFDYVLFCHSEIIEFRDPQTNKNCRLQ
jgi:hypothetical protein